MNAKNVEFITMDHTTSPSPSTSAKPRDSLILAPKRLRELHDPLSENLSKTPKLASYESPTRIINIIQKRFDKQHEEIQFLMEKMEQRILNEMNNRLSYVKHDIIQEVKNELKNEFKSVIDKLTTKISSFEERIEKLELASIENANLKSAVNDLNLRLLQQENLIVANDVRINGIPEYENENLPVIFDNICKYLNISNIHLISIYRVRNIKNIRGIKDGAIVAKLQTPYEKNFLLKVVAEYKRNIKGHLKLQQIGIDGDVPFYINENLTPFNHKIFSSALKIKKENRIKAVYTLRGIVYIKIHDSDEPLCIRTFEELNRLFR